MREIWSQLTTPSWLFANVLVALLVSLTANFLFKYMTEKEILNRMAISDGTLRGIFLAHLALTILFGTFALALDFLQDIETDDDRLLNVQVAILLFVGVSAMWAGFFSLRLAIISRRMAASMLTTFAVIFVLQAKTIWIMPDHLHWIAESYFVAASFSSSLFCLFGLMRKKTRMAFWP